MAYSGLRIAIGSTNRDPLFLLDMARRQADHVGPRGIASKAGQTNRLFKKRGYIRLAHLKRREAKKIEQRIAELGEPAILVQRFRNPGKRMR